MAPTEYPLPDCEPAFVLTWEDGSLVTLELTDDQKVLLVLPDADTAEGARAGVAAAAGRVVEVAQVDAPADGIRDALEVLLGMAGNEPVTPLFPEHPLYGVLLGQLG